MAEEIQFEKALEKLEKIVEDLEAGNISLEDALKKYEEGVRLSAVCQKRLSAAEKKIEVLSKSLDGSFKKEPFDSEEEDAEEKPARRSPKGVKPAKQESAEDEEDLLI